MKFSTRKGVPTIKVTINGKGAKFLIDSGANSSFVDSSLARKFAFNIVENNAVLHGAGGKVQMYDVYKCKIVTEDGPLDIRMKAIDFSNVREGFGIAGIIGSDYLIKNKMNIDYSTKQLYTCSE